ncbi:MAG: hypothetical protein CFE45_22595 [Burkholderiales bacterium PBB5]|nr:MAG: hypothetical protein CFE45_22595 [Burkholderiales bacterium PBB5]
MVQARGLDAAGAPQVLHSVVPTTAATMVAHVTPLTDAVVALALGTAPRPVFAAGTASAKALPALANAAAAQAFLKTLIKVQFSDAKVTDASKLDVLSDSSFVANKGAHDLVIEGLRMAYGRSAAGADQLLLAGKLLVNQAVEVQVDLPTAATELAKTTGATPANAVLSTLKATTGSSKVIANVPVLDELSAALNRLIAQGPTATTAASNALISGYLGSDGRTLTNLAAMVARWATGNLQFGRWQLVGCADETQAAGDCTLLRVAAPLSNSTGTVVEVFEDVVSYNSKAAAGLPKWGLVGNSRKRALAVNPVSALWLAADGTAIAATNTAPNPAVGVMVLAQAQDSTGTKVQDAAVVQTPGGYSVPMAYCTLGWLCRASTGGATTATATGDLADTALMQPTVGWIGSTDGQRGARYVFSMTVGSTAETRYAYLRASLSTEAAARHPRLDGVAAITPLLASALQAAWTADWTTWAAANPDLRLLQIRRVFTDGTTTTIVDNTAPLPGTTTLALDAPTLDITPTQVDCWLIAEDAYGRRVMTHYVTQ